MKTKAAFPNADEVAKTWGWPKVRVLPFEYGHGAQRLLRTPDDGDWVLKRARVATESLGAFGDVLGAIAALGKRVAPAAFPELRPTREGAWTLARGDARYYLMRRAEGRGMSFRSLDSTRRACEALASYHAGAAEAATALRTRLGIEEGKSAAAIWAPAARAWEELEERIERRGGETNWMGRHFVRRHPETRWFFEKARSCIETLQGAKPLPVTMTHGDTHANNFLIGRDCVWLLDIESYAWRPAALDLIVPLTYCARFHGWRPDKVERALESYESLRPLGAAERRVIAALLIYPRQWMRGMTALMRRRKRFSTGPLGNLFSAELGTRAKKEFAEYVLRQW